MLCLLMFHHLQQPFLFVSVQRWTCVNNLNPTLHPTTPVARDLHDFLQKQKIPKYKKLPDVEVSFKAGVRTI